MSKDDTTEFKAVLQIGGGCLALLLAWAFATLVVGGLTYLVVNVIFGGDLSFWACCGVGLILGLFIGGSPRR